MKSVVVLYKDEDGAIYCHKLSEKGVLFYKNEDSEDGGYWEEGGTIVLSELEEILDSEV
jgi:hypothetical protein